MDGHAFLPPSGAGVWVYCPAAPSVWPQYAQITRPRTRLGDAAHWVIEQCLTPWTKPDTKCAVAPAYYKGQTAPNGVVIDDEIVEGAAVMTSEVLALCQRHGALRGLLVEQPLTMPRVHPTVNWGRPDVVIIVWAIKLVIIIDYKHGNRYVPAAGNWQLTNYAEGVAEHLRLNGYSDQDWRVEFKIVQPFAYRAEGPVSTWSGTFADLRAPINSLTDAAHRATTDPTLCAGAWCRDCPASGDCAAADRAAGMLLDFLQVPLHVSKKDSRDLATFREQILEARDLLKGIESAVEDEITHRLKSGQVVESLALETTRGRNDWTADPDVVEAVCQQFKVSAKKVALRTPVQVSSDVPAALRDAFAATIQTMTERPVRSVKIVNADDTTAARAFKRK